MPADAAMSSHHIKAVVERVSWNVLAATIATMLHAPHTRPLASMPAVPPDLQTTRACQNPNLFVHPLYSSHPGAVCLYYIYAGGWRHSLRMEYRGALPDAA